MGRPQLPNEDRERLLHQADSPAFSGVTFGPAFLNAASLRFNSQGALSVTLIIPPESQDAALDLRYLVRNPMPLQVTMIPYAPWMAHRQQAEARIQALPS